MQVVAVLLAVLGAAVVVWAGWLLVRPAREEVQTVSPHWLQQYRQTDGR